MVASALIAKIHQLESLGGTADIQGIDLIVSERIRQISQENWSPEWDDKERRFGQLASAAASYAISGGQKAFTYAKTGSLDIRPSAPHSSWPFSITAWKPASIRRMTVKASALLLAELARLIRAGLD